MPVPTNSCCTKNFAVKAMESLSKIEADINVSMLFLHREFREGIYICNGKLARNYEYDLEN